MNCQTIVSCELILVSIVVDCTEYVGSMYIVHVLEALHPERQPKQVVVKIK
jgi:hypothetical protein